MAKLLFAAGGFIAGYMSAVPILNALFFGIPFTKKLAQRGVVTNAKAVMKKYRFDLSVWGGFLLVLLLLLCAFVSRESFVLFLFGLGVSVIFNLTRFGENDFNIKTYVNQNRQYISAKKNSEFRDGLSYTIGQCLKGK